MKNIELILFLVFVGISILGSVAKKVQELRAKRQAELNRQRREIDRYRTGQPVEGQSTDAGSVEVFTVDRTAARREAEVQELRRRAQTRAASRPPAPRPSAHQVGPQPSARPVGIGPPASGGRRSSGGRNPPTPYRGQPPAGGPRRAPAPTRAPVVEIEPQSEPGGPAPAPPHARVQARPQPQPRCSRAAAVAALLRDRRSLRTALVLSEVLGPPASERF